MGEWEIVKEPTCTEEGIREQVCSCGEKITEKIPKLEHSFVDGFCTYCGAKESESICSHDEYEIIYEKIPTCTESGIKSGIKCLDCGELIAERGEVFSIVSALGQSHCFAGDTCKWCGEAIPESSSGLEFELNDDGESYTLVGASNCTEEHVIVSTYNGKPVTKIAEGAFSSIDGRIYKSISLGDSVKHVSSGAFSFPFSFVMQFNVGNGVENLGESVAAMLILRINISESNSSFLIDGNLLCTKDGKTLVKYTAFSTNCFRFVSDEKLKSCNSMENLVANFKENYTDLISNSYVPENFDLQDAKGSVGWCAEFVTPENITAIGPGAFYGLSPKKIVVGDNVNSLIDRPFAKCVAEEIIIGNGITEISVSEFLLCSNLETVTIGKNVTNIPKGAFFACMDLVEVINLSGVDLSNYDFGAQSWPIAIHDGEESLIRKDEDGFVFISFEGVNYLCGYEGDETNLILPDDFNYVIASGAFYGDTNIDSIISIIIPDNVTEIKDSAFFHCDGIVEVTIGNGVTSIREQAFYSCDSLKSVALGTSVTSIGDKAFSECRIVEVINKSSLIIEPGSHDYGYIAYYALEVHTAEGRITNQNNYLFYTHEGTHYLIGYIGNETDLVLPESFKNENYKIFDCAFNNKSITSVVISYGVTSIGIGAFDFCASLEKVEISNSVKSIGDYAFNFCASLTSILIPDSVTSIGTDAFYNASSLVEIHYIGTEEDWEKIDIAEPNDTLESVTIIYHPTLEE